MRVFLYQKNGYLNVMRTYGLTAGGRVITPADTDLEEAVPAPSAAEVMAKWPVGKQAGVSNIREVQEADIPADPTFRAAWEDTGSAVTVNMTKARAIQASRLAMQIADEDRAHEETRKREQLEGKADPGAKTQRDLSQIATDIAAASRPDDLKAVTLK